MKKLGYCIWFCPEKTHPWYRYTNKFPPHLTIKNNLSYQEALLLLIALKKQKLTVEFDYLMCGEIDGMHSLHYTIKEPDNKPEWWPKNPHISFLYKYDKKVTPQEVNYLYTHMPVKTGTLDGFHLVNCNGHYKDWKVMHSKMFNN